MSSSIAYIETGLEHLPKSKRHDSPLIRMLVKLRDFFWTMSIGDEVDTATSMDRTKKELSDAGLSYFQLERRESRHIASYLNADEHIHGAIRGHVKDVGSALMVATDSRVLYLHEVPFFSNFEEFTYDIASGISLNNMSHILSSVRIFTKFKTYELDYVNTRSAELFVKYIETRLYVREKALLHEGERRLLMQKT